MIAVEYEEMSKIGKLFLKLSDAYNLLSKEEKHLLRKCFPNSSSIENDFFQALEIGYCAVGQLSMRAFIGEKEINKQSWIAACEELGEDPGELFDSEDINKGEQQCYIL